MRQFYIVALALFCALLLPACTTEREYSVSHERLVDAAMQALVDETRIGAGEIKRSDSEPKGGKLTILEAPYVTYSRVKIEIDSSDEHSKMPELQVKVSTGKIAWTRHKDLEQRIHESVALKLRAKKHGDESKPTALPAKTPVPAPEKK